MTLLFQDESPESVEKPCPLGYWFQCELLRKPREKVVSSWHADTAPGYSNEKYSANLTDKCVAAKLDGGGKTKHNNIPAGTSDIEFPEFYSEIEEWLKKQIDG